MMEKNVCDCESKETKKKQKMEYTVKDGVATFVDSKGRTFFVDSDDAERVAEYTWCVNGNGYVQCWVTGKYVYLHRFVMGLVDSEDKTLMVDHRDGRKVNNCKENLRICTNQENQRNRKDVKGIYKNSNGTYQAYIAVDGKQIHLGTYESEQMARAVRLIAEKEYFGEFSSNVDLFEDPETKRLYEEAMESIRLRHKNKVRIDEDVVYVTASSKEFVIDLEDYEKIKNYKWYNERGRIRAWIDGELQQLARHLLGLPKGDRTKRVRFKDGNNLNFRRENLQVVECKTKTKNEESNEKGGN